MRPYKTGDRVRVKAGDHSIPRGTCGTITWAMVINSFPRGIYGIRWDDNSTGAYARETVKKVCGCTK